MEDGAFPQSHCVCQRPSTRSSLLVELIAIVVTQKSRLRWLVLAILGILERLSSLHQDGCTHGWTDDQLSDNKNNLTDNNTNTLS